ncbi:MAG: molybdopterin molybdenumtransferase MoeA [Ignavibacteriae bacterium HGW-Ignavibacteriae-3]|nr:MAG: molybdopterin molybdenumtransferase MoeA [Ignavibacteriae bacterium HGW-Ignavibacteriae-3]
MILLEDALNIIRLNLIVLSAENIDFRESVNRVLREDIISDIDMPPFNKSAMDGYACRREDLDGELSVIEIIQAGYQPQKKIGKHECSKIMTGAIIPDGADCVIIIEEVEVLSGNKIKFTGQKTSDNICIQGEDVVTGQKLISEGTRISAKEIASLALSGNVNPKVSKKPKVGIIATGDEIVEPDLKPEKSQIRNTNSYQLLAQSVQFGCDVTYYGIAHDTEAAIGEIITKAKNENDLIIITGGVSMGDFDLVPSVLIKNGFKILFDQVAIQPGKPTVFGRDDNKFVFGMPGNPVSSFICFEIFVKEFLAGMMGLKDHSKVLRMQLAKDIKRKKNKRLAWIPVKINGEGKIEPVEYHGSAHINALAFADGITSIPIGTNEIKAGSIVNVRQF